MCGIKAIGSSRLLTRLAREKYWAISEGCVSHVCLSHTTLLTRDPQYTPECREAVQKRCPGGVVFVVLEFVARSGGPEAMHQLHAAVNEAGGCSVMTGDVPEFRTRFSRMVGGGKAWKEFPMGRGDTMVLPEGKLLSKGDTSRYLRQQVRLVAFHIGQITHRVRALASESYRPMCLNHYFQQLYHCPPNAVAWTPIGRRFFDTVSNAPHETPKENLVLVDNDERDWRAVDVQALRAAVPAGTEVVWMAGFSYEEVMRLYARAKVMLDLYVPGAERNVYEASLFNCLVVVGFNGNARDGGDVPIPAEGRLVDLDETAVGRALGPLLENYEAELPKWQPLRDLTASMATSFGADLALFFGADATFITVAQKQSEVAALGARILATVAQYPYADALYAVGDVPFFESEHGALLAGLRHHGNINSVRWMRSAPESPLEAISGLRSFVCVFTDSAKSVAFGRRFLADQIALLRVSDGGLVLDSRGVRCMRRDTFLDQASGVAELTARPFYGDGIVVSSADGVIGAEWANEVERLSVSSLWAAAAPLVSFAMSFDYTGAAGRPEKQMDATITCSVACIVNAARDAALQGAELVLPEGVEVSAAAAVGLRVTHTLREGAVSVVDGGEARLKEAADIEDRFFQHVILTSLAVGDAEQAVVAVSRADEASLAALVASKVPQKHPVVAAAPFDDATLAMFREAGFTLQLGAAGSAWAKFGLLSRANLTILAGQEDATVGAWRKARGKGAMTLWSVPPESLFEVSPAHAGTREFRSQRWGSIDSVDVGTGVLRLTVPKLLDLGIVYVVEVDGVEVATAGPPVWDDAGWLTTPAWALLEVSVNRELLPGEAVAVYARGSDGQKAEVGYSPFVRARAWAAG